MASPSRIWKGEDSSNDARSSGSDDDCDDDDNLDAPPTVKSLGIGKDMGLRKGKKGGLKGRTEIPSSTADESSQSQRRKIEELQAIQVCATIEVGNAARANWGQESEDEAETRGIESEDDAPPSSQPRPISSDEEYEAQDSTGPLADVAEPEVKTSKRKRKRDKKEKRTAKEDNPPQLQASQEWYEGDEIGETVVEVAEPKAKKIKKSKKGDAANLIASAQNTESKPAQEQSATKDQNQDHDEVSVIDSSKSGGKTKAQRRREKRAKKARAKKAEQGETTSAYFAPPENAAKRSHEQRMASDEANRERRKRKTDACAAGAEVPAAKAPAAEKADTEAKAQCYVERYPLPKGLENSIAKSRQAVEAAKANVPVWDEAPKKEKKESSKKQVMTEEVEQTKEKNGGRRKRKRNNNALLESDAGQPVAQDGDSEKMNSAESIVKPVKQQESKVAIGAQGGQEDADDAEQPKKKARKCRKPKTAADQAVTDVEPMVSVVQTTASDLATPKPASDQAGAHAPSEKKRRSRGKKSKKETETESAPAEEPAENKPLTELPNTNTKKVKAGRRNRGKKDKSAANTMDVDTEIANEDSKDYHS
jgi:hypothetical protein